MKISIIGAGDVGSALARGFARANHQIVLGVRNLDAPHVNELTTLFSNIAASSIDDAIQKSDVILFSTPPAAVVDIAKRNAELQHKIIIDATNSIFRAPEPYKNAFDAIKSITGCNHVAKCFNSTGFENMADPRYNTTGIDMFVAGDSVKAKQVASQLAKEIGFAECYDFGGDDKVELLEQLAFCWINLAIMQKNGRNMAFKVLKR